MTRELWDALESAEGASWAVLQAGEHLTRYLRVGRGAPGIVLPSPQRNSAFWVALNAELSRTHRVMIPDHAGPTLEMGGWYRGFLDGIGLPSAALIVAEEFALAALECALLEPEMVSHLVLVPNPGPDAGVLEGQLSAAHVRAQIPVLVLGPGMSDGEGIAQLTEFLAPMHR